MSGYAVANALSTLRAALQTMLDEDGVIVTDIAAELPEETATLDEALRYVVRGVLNDRAMAEACEAQMEALKLRAQRFWKREERGCELIQAAMGATAMRKKILPEATLSMRDTAGPVIVTDETLLAEEYIRRKAEPNRGAIGDALKAGKTVAGATRGNGGVSLTIRVA